MEVDLGKLFFWVILIIMSCLFVKICHKIRLGDGSDY